MDPDYRSYHGSGITDTTYTVHQLDDAGNDKGVSSASIFGGYQMPDSDRYQAHPKIGDDESRKFYRGTPSTLPKGFAEQGELFNWVPPKISGLYRSNDSPKSDTMAALGLAVKGARKAFGVEPKPDEQLSADSAPIAAKLTGQQFSTTYNAGESKSALRRDGDRTATRQGQRARYYERDREGGSKRLEESDIQEGSDLIRNKLRESIAARKAPLVNKVAELTGKLPDVKSLKNNRQQTLPGM
ncbi:hypothetical protein UFOVP965_112 [uncultured Caudovirales phage]|uniref:Uncharacterized protein n=1 Tax=uncultured Caudovirales phage TaxID=2100421 RepID=A0A6J5PTC8_9CAUD|nr:hypothetical protein UFOVP965_112 [uncultured Caudovirales phage]CAB4179901.1 hypothetical protein UFOVP1035_108 [uncultured Caudovirales phage]CAB4188724.1 hypothetical protein UFOVP1181_67 [uncultured Caudovirales phage]